MVFNGLEVGGTGRDHREHVGCLVYRDVDDAGAWARQRVGDFGERIAGVDGNALATHAEGLSKRREIRPGVEMRGSVAAVEK